MVKTPPIWLAERLKDQAESITCTDCKQVILYNPGLYNEDFIYGIIVAHKKAHERAAHLQHQEQSDDCPF